MRQIEIEGENEKEAHCEMRTIAQLIYVND